MDEFDDERTWGNPKRYNVAKLLNVLWARELVAKTDPKEIVINTVNPGSVKIALHRENMNNMENKFTELFYRTTEKDARNPI